MDFLFVKPPNSTEAALKNGKKTVSSSKMEERFKGGDPRLRGEGFCLLGVLRATELLREHSLGMKCGI